MNEFDRIYGELSGDASDTPQPSDDNDVSDVSDVSEKTEEPEEAAASAGDMTEIPAEDAAESPTEDTPEEAAKDADEAVGGEPAEPVAEEEPAAYRWTYGAQNEYDKAAAGKKEKKTGVAVYAIIMAAVFAVAFGLLLGVLLMTDREEWDPDRPAGDVLSDAEIGANIEKAKQSVVLIQVSTASGGGTGSGVVYNSKGYIATNHHVIEGAEKVLVTFANGDMTYAEVIGSSEMDDLAIIKVNPAELSHALVPAEFGEYADVYVCQTVMAIGAPAGEEFCWTVTKGIVSYKDREVRKYNADGTMAKKLRTLQTDANVNPGNSGGPLVDVYGRVVGIVSMKLVGDYEGMGFAIPSDGAIEILDAIIRDGNADSVNSSLSFKRPVLGIVGVYMEKDHTYVMDDVAGQIYDVTEGVSELTKDDVWNEIVVSGGKPVGPINPGASGIYVCSVTAGTGADGVLEPGDVIQTVNLVEASSMNALMNELNKHYVGDSVVLSVWRDGQSHSITMILSESTQ